MQRTPGPLSSADDATARQAAADASALAANARQMVLNRDALLNGASSAAAAADAKADAATLAAASAGTKADAAAAQLATMPRVIATGQAKTTSLLALGGSVDVVVTLSRAMPSATYNVEVIPISTGLISGNATLVVKSKTTTTVTLTITALVAVAASSVVSVIAWG